MPPGIGIQLVYRLGINSSSFFFPFLKLIHYTIQEGVFLLEKDSVVLELRGISKSFPGVQALSNVNMKVHRGTVHALMGENGAGKSTLMKCLFGIYSRDSGEIFFDGKPVRFAGSGEAIESGISMIHQELYPQRFLSVMENVWVGRLPTKGIIVDKAMMFNKTAQLLQELEIDLNPRVKMEELSVSQMQCVEIARAVSFHSKIIIMDEPTSSLTGKEVEHLFKIIRKLRSKGVSLIYISHRIEEILQISDAVSVMRDGKMIGCWDAKGLTNDFIISQMVGREMNQLFPQRNNTPGDVILEVEDFTSPLPKCFQHVSFKVRKGEIFGIGGLVGAQRTELIEAMFGLRRATGALLINGQVADIKNPVDAKRYKMALLTEDRRNTGIFGLLSVRENMAIANYPRYSNRFGVLHSARITRDIKDSIQKLQIKTPSLKSLIKNLSGGNQQKVLFARWLLTEPEILFLDEPTRGIDVGAKYEIYCMIAQLAKQGKSIVMITSEMLELINMSDRVLVMCEGKVSGELTGESISEMEIMRLCAKFDSKTDS